MRLAVLTSHPIQYQAPWFRELAKLVDLHVYFAHQQTAAQQGAAGYGVAFDWDVDLLDGYSHSFLPNYAARPGTDHFLGCDNRTLAAEMERLGPSALVVCGWNLKCHWQAVRAARQLGIPVLSRGDSHLGTPRGLAKRLVKQAAYRGALSAFDGFLAVGTNNVEYLLHYGVPEAKIFHAPHCVDVERFRSAANRAASERLVARARIGVDGNAVVWLFVGRFLDWKRPADLLRAAAQAGVDASHCVFVGAGPQEAELRELAKRLKVNAAFLGFRNQAELPHLYALADALVLPSDGNETWGLVVNEAMACGTTCVVSDAAGCAPDMIRAGRTGESFPCGNVAQFAQALRRAQIYAGTEGTRQELAAITERHSPRAAAEGAANAAHALASRHKRAS